MFMQNNNVSHNMYAYMGKEITIFPEDYLVGRTNLLTISTTYGYVQSLNKLADLK